MTERVPPDILLEFGIISRAPANNTPHWTYGKGDRCSHVLELPVNESRIWCPLCSLEGDRSQLRKIFHVPHAPQIWHEFYCQATGRVESDRKKMEQHGRAHADQISEDLGIAHAFERTDYGELRQHFADTRGHDLEGPVVNKHNQDVEAGKKESRGKFVWD